MVVKVFAGLVTLAALAVIPLPARAIADAGAPVLVQTPGGILCLVSANDPAHGGSPTVACQLKDNGPFPQAPFSSTKPNPKLNLAVVRGSGQFQWEYGSVAGGQPTTLAAGQTMNVNGWTITAAEGRSTYAYGEAAHGFWIGPDYVHPN